MISAQPAAAMIAQAVIPTLRVSLPLDDIGHISVTEYVGNGSVQFQVYVNGEPVTLTAGLVATDRSEFVASLKSSLSLLRDRVMETADRQLSDALDRAFGLASEPPTATASYFVRG